MKFDFAIGSEAGYEDWVDDGCKKAAELLDSIVESDDQSAENAPIRAIPKKS
jgi:hypothetical protein